MAALYHDQFGRQFSVPDLDDKPKQHKAAMHIAVGMLDPAQRAEYEAGRLRVTAVDELGRKHHMIFAAPGVIGLRR